MAGPRILIINEDYAEFLDWFYSSYPSVRQASYDEQLHKRVESLFGLADFYSRSFRQLGWHAADIFSNNRILQQQWAKEHGKSDKGSLKDKALDVARRFRRLAAGTPLRRLRPVVAPALALLNETNDWMAEILTAQIADFSPDVILNLDVFGVDVQWLRQAAPGSCVIAGQIASILPPDRTLQGYDLLVSALPSFVARFRRLGIPAALNRFAFDPKVLTHLRPSRSPVAVSFVGSFYDVHQNRLKLLEEVSSRCEVQIWGAMSNDVRRRFESSHRGTAWGVEMYNVLFASKMTLNCHEQIAESHAANMRLFEATGVGTLLITDAKDDLSEIFEPGIEVVAFRTPEECADLVVYYLEHEQERTRIARRGQERTLRDHTYERRMRDLAAVILAGA